MYPIPPSEHLIETKICRHCGESFAITDKDVEFYEKVSPTFSGKKYQIPTPTICPDCRQQRRLSFHNERKLYKRKCDATGKDIISEYPEISPLTIYHQDYYWSDAWDPISFGRDYDSSESFFQQFDSFAKKVPKQALVVQNAENSDYLNFAYNIKNCYLIFASSMSEDCYFGNRVNESKGCLDCLLVKQSENCYECITAFNCSHCFYSQRIKSCSQSSFLEDCMGCDHCLMCVNLQNKKFYIKNKEYSENEYFQELEKIKNKSVIELRDEYLGFIKSEPRKGSNFINTNGCFGENLQNAKNAKYVFDGDALENVSYGSFVDDVTDSMDINYGYGNTVLQYESLGTGVNAHNILFSINVWPDVYSLIYCDTCIGCSYCFGCIGLKNKKYCILNKQYTKEEYEELVPKIIEKMIVDGEWGEFFPSSMSPFGYNETVAQEYFPMTASSLALLPEGEGNETFREAIVPSPSPLGEGLRVRWSLYEAPFPKVEKIIRANMLPDDISEIPDDILNWAIECEVTKKPFRIIKQELEFYRKHDLPIPKRHPDQRHLDRMALRNPRKLFERKCDKCGKDIITTYSPERSETVYCEECYNKEIIG